MRARHPIACTACVAVAAWAARALAADPSPTRYSLPPGVLRVSDARLQAGTGEHVTFTVKLTRRAVAKGALELTLPRLWTGRSGVSGLAYAMVPSAGSASSRRATVRLSGRVVRFAFDGARTNDSARYTVADKGLPARTYELRYAWRERGRASRRGTATVVVFATTRPPP